MATNEELIKGARKHLEPYLKLSFIPPIAYLANELCNALEKEIEQKHGYWIAVETVALGIKSRDYKCSGCDYTNDDTSQYCPSCGAKMDLDIKKL